MCRLVAFLMTALGETHSVRAEAAPYQPTVWLAMSFQRRIIDVRNPALAHIDADDCYANAASLECHNARQR